MSYIKLVSIGIFISFIICIKSNNCQSNPKIELEDIAKNALIEKYDLPKNERFIINQKKVPFWNGINIFHFIILGDEEPSPEFIVVIDKKKEVHIFSEILTTKEFNRLVKENKINIDENNLKHFINIFLYLVDNYSRVISGYDDFGYFQNIITEKEKNKIGPLRPIKYKIRENEITAEFFSWAASSNLKKWNITFSHSGKIITYNFKALYEF